MPKIEELNQNPESEGEEPEETTLDDLIEKNILRQAILEVIADEENGLGFYVKKAMVDAGGDLSIMLTRIADENKALAEREARLGGREAKADYIEKSYALFQEWETYMIETVGPQIRDLEDARERQFYERQNDERLAHFAGVMAKYQGYQREAGYEPY